MSTPDPLPEIEQYRSYLLLLARMQLDAQNHVEASDVVQVTLLEAYAMRAQFTGNEAALAAWLRQALANNLRDAWRNARRQKRDVRREISLEVALDESSSRLANCLAVDHSTPSRVASRNEELLKLSDCLMQLAELQREAIVLHHLQGWKLKEVAEKLNRSEAAVAGLLHRGLQQLRIAMSNPGT
jgi:RNA polymerase sigma-70 factor, ECF subfamily